MPSSYLTISGNCKGLFVVVVVVVVYRSILLSLFYPLCLNSYSDTQWNGPVIVVLGDTWIHPPYTPESVSGKGTEIIRKLVCKDCNDILFHTPTTYMHAHHMHAHHMHTHHTTWLGPFFYLNIINA